MLVDEKISVIEAVLFASGDPVEKSLLCELIDTDKENLDKLIVLLRERYLNISSALEILELGDTYQFAARREFAPVIKTALEEKKNSTLSQAAFEVLTIVAYNQPVTKGFVENIRGVDSSSVVNSLVEKGLLEEAGRIDVPGRPVAYKTTEGFLRTFQMSSLDELPPIPDSQIQQQLDDGQISFDDESAEKTETDTETSDFTESPEDGQ